MSTVFCKTRNKNVSASAESRGILSVRRIGSADGYIHGNASGVFPRAHMGESPKATPARPRFAQWFSKKIVNISFEYVTFELWA